MPVIHTVKAQIVTKIVYSTPQHQVHCDHGELVGYRPAAAGEPRVLAQEILPRVPTLGEDICPLCTDRARAGRR